MKISASNIGWPAREDGRMYEFLRQAGARGLEVAPTRLFEGDPYKKIKEAGQFAASLKENYGLVIPSVQSVWYGEKENIFDGDSRRAYLLDRIKRAVDFARALGAYNIVFGCPRNRNVPWEMSREEAFETAVGFFLDAGRYRAENGVFIALEPNPPIYYTNFLTDTDRTGMFVRDISRLRRAGAEGIRLNFDMGSALYNAEKSPLWRQYADLVNHVHLSEPDLAPVERREKHKELLKVLKDRGYDGFVSVEAKNGPNAAENIKRAVLYAKEIFDREHPSELILKERADSADFPKKPDGVDEAEPEENTRNKKITRRRRVF